VVNDKKKGMITYIRVYSGTLKSAQKLLNTNVNQAERPMQLFRIKADDIDAIQEVINKNHKKVNKHVILNTCSYLE
jgi:elongation factor G